MVMGTGCIKGFPYSSMPPVPQEPCKAPHFTSAQKELAPASGLHVQKTQHTVLYSSFSLASAESMI